MLLWVTGAAAAAYALGIAALHPRQVALALIPVMVWSAPLTIAGIPLTVPAVALVFVGVMLSRRVGPVPRALSWTFAGFTVATALSVVAHEPPQALLPSEARNSAITLVLVAALVPIYAKARPPVTQLLRWLALSLSGSALYLALTGSISGGRLVAEATNSNSAGYAAASGILACALCAKNSGRYLTWVVVALPSLYVLYAAQSRGAFTALAVGVVVAAMVGLDGPRRLAATAFGVVAAILLWGPLASITSDVLLAERSQQFVESDSRELVLRLAWAAFKEAPTGIGYAHFPDLSRPYFGFALNTHNDWVRLFVEGGVALGVLALVLLPGRLLTRGVQRGDARLKVLLSAGCVAFLFSNSMTDLRVSAPALVCAGLLWTARSPGSADRAWRVNPASNARPDRLAERGVEHVRPAQSVEAEGREPVAITPTCT